MRTRLVEAEVVDPWRGRRTTWQGRGAGGSQDTMAGSHRPARRPTISRLSRPPGARCSSAPHLLPWASDTASSSSVTGDVQPPPAACSAAAALFFLSVVLLHYCCCRCNSLCCCFCGAAAHAAAVYIYDGAVATTVACNGDVPADAVYGIPTPAVCNAAVPAAVYTTATSAVDWWWWCCCY